MRNLAAFEQKQLDFQKNSCVITYIVHYSHTVELPRLEFSLNHSTRFGNGDMTVFTNKVMCYRHA